MTRVRKTHGEGFKFKVALAALKGDRTLGELSREYVVSVGAIQKGDVPISVEIRGAGVAG